MEHYSSQTGQPFGKEANQEQLLFWTNEIPECKWVLVDINACAEQADTKSPQGSGLRPSIHPETRCFRSY